MSKHIDKLLPFYLNRTLEASSASRVEGHLAGCARCQASLTQWERLARAAGRAVPEAGCLPPLASGAHWAAPAFAAPGIGFVAEPCFSARRVMFCAGYGCWCWRW